MNHQNNIPPDYLFRNGERFCERHRYRAPAKGGAYVATPGSNGRRRWLCAACIERLTPPAPDAED